jgi:hypothetical protein
LYATLIHDKVKAYYPRKVAIKILLTIEMLHPH